MKLVFEYKWSDGYTMSGTNTFPVEYSSIEDLQYLILEECKKHKDEQIKVYGKKAGNDYYRNGYIYILGEEFNVGHLEDSIYNIYTAETWFDKFALNDKI